MNRRRSALTILLAILPLWPPASRLTAGDGANAAPEPQEKIVIASPEREIVVDENGVFVSGDEDAELPADLPDLDDFPGDIRASERGYIGVRPLGMTPELREHFGAPKDAGVLVGSVEADSPAARAGLAVGDIITGVGGEPVGSPPELARLVRHRAGETLSVQIVRNRSAKTLSVTVGKGKAEELEIGDLRPMPGFHDRGPGRPKGRVVLPPPHGLAGLEDRLEGLEKRLKELEDRLPSP